MTTYSILEIKCIVFIIVWSRVWAEYVLQCGVTFCWLSIIPLKLMMQRAAVKHLNQRCLPSWPWHLQLANGQAYDWLPQLAWSSQAICFVMVLAGLAAASPDFYRLATGWADQGFWARLWPRPDQAIDVREFYNTNLQGKLKKLVRVLWVIVTGREEQMTKSKTKNNDYCASVHAVYIYLFNQIQGRLKLMVTR